MEDMNLEKIAELMTQKLIKERVIHPKGYIRSTDVVKVPDNYQEFSGEKKRMAVYVACVRRVLAIAILYDDGKIRTHITGVSHR